MDKRGDIKKRRITVAIETETGVMWPQVTEY